MESRYYTGKLIFKRNVRLLLLNPVHPDHGLEGPFKLTLRDYLLRTTIVDEIYCPGGPRSLENPGDVEQALPLVVEKTRWAASQGYDAVVVNCMLDPGVREAKCAVPIPVIGLGEATAAVAILVGKYPARIFPRNIPVRELAIDQSKTFNELVGVSRRLVGERGRDVLIPNCAYLGGLAQRLQKEVGVPVLPNLDIGLRLAELLAVFGVSPEQYWVEATRGPRSRRVRNMSRIASRGASIIRSLIVKLS